MSKTPQDAAAPESFYVAHEKIYPREVMGRFSRLRHIAVFVLLGIYYLLPWFQWEGRQAVLFDLPARKFHIFGLTFWPQDFFFLAWLLIIAALALFFFTALAGRLWCGYACPQTVWTEAFLYMERLTEGNHSQRRKLDAGPWNRNKIVRKGAKQILWIVFALFTGATFVGYFTPIRELIPSLFAFTASGWQWFWVLFYGFATYGNAGLMREQVCKYMCPYARFQSAMFDKDTMVISYDTARGEPRGGRKRSVEPASVGLGDCIDCNMCVQVCPTGIDIRDGLQYECIACAACVDVCDSVMDKMGYSRGLVRYTTDNAMASGKPPRVVRPRILVYAALLTLLAGGFVYSVANRSPVIVEVIRDRNSIFREVRGGFVENVYSLKIVNKTDQDQAVAVSAAGLPDVRLIVDSDDLSVPAGAVRRLPVRIQVPAAGAPDGAADVVVRIEGGDDDQPFAVERTSRFIGPSS